MRVEVRGPNGWVLAGKVFDSHYDFDWVPATPENVRMLDDGTLVCAAAPFYEYDNREYADFDAFRERLTPTVRAALEAALVRQAADKERIGAFRAERSGDWDPQAYRDFGRRLMREQRDAVEKLSGEDRASLETALCEFRYTYGDEDGMGDEDRLLSLSLHRAEGDPPFKTETPWEGRNYDLFAMLANVRNGHGFAGVPTGEGFVPISEPRDVPLDVSAEGAAFMDSYGVDGHSHTYHTLRELREYDWDGQGTVSFGVVSAAVYEKMLAEKGGMCHPFDVDAGGYSASTSGPGIVTFTPEGYETWKAAGKPKVGAADDWGVAAVGPRAIPSPATQAAGLAGQVAEVDEAEVEAYVQVRWNETYRAAAGKAWFEAMDAMAELIPEGGTDEDVRLICFFDN